MYLPVTSSRKGYRPAKRSVFRPWPPSVVSAKACFRCRKLSPQKYLGILLASGEPTLQNIMVSTWESVWHFFQQFSTGHIETQLRWTAAAVKGRVAVKQVMQRKNWGCGWVKYWSYECSLLGHRNCVMTGDVWIERERWCGWFHGLEATVEVTKISNVNYFKKYYVFIII